MSRCPMFSRVVTALGGAVAALTCQTAFAAIVYVDVPDASVIGQELDMDGDGQPNIVFGIEGDPGSQEITVEPSFAFRTGHKSYFSAWFGMSSGGVAKLPAGVEVALMSNSFSWGTTFASLTMGLEDDMSGAYAWSLPGEGYMAVRADVPGGGGFWHYGWVHLERPSDFFDLRISEFAYESTPLAPIVTGVIPAPGVLALLGIAGMASARRRN